MDTPRISNRKVIASVQNAINILNLFNDGCNELGNAEIARSLHMNPATAAGLVYTLKVNKYLDQNPSNHKYRLGLKIAERAAVLLEQLDLRKIAGPYLEDVRDWCGESVNLAILDGREVVYIERLFGHHALGIRLGLGKRAPVHSTALGKSIAAYLSDAELRLLLEGYYFQPLTAYTIRSSSQFKEDLAIIRQRGYAIDDQENELGGCCIGAPIFDRTGHPIAAISISAPIHRLPIEQVPTFGEKLQATAYEISQQFGYQNLP